ncbi:MAG: prepilin peptidase [Bacilli bacterium]|nr:prepilin peptidase [Bacilli bacterium]
MQLSICIFLFVLGTILGSFYNVVGYRLPKNESIVKPPSHCPKCNHRLEPWELIPIVSFLLQRGKCTKCKEKISWYYPIFETACGILFVLSYLSFGLTYELIIVLTFISMLMIVMVSDYHYMIIPDEVLIFFGIAIIVEKCIIYGISNIPKTLLSGVIAFAAMYLLKKFGDLIFKQESMGGGDIKLLGIFGLMLGWPNALISIIIGSFIGLPISLIAVNLKKTHIVPFGPFLSMGAIVVLLTKLDIATIIEALMW